MTKNKTTEPAFLALIDAATGGDLRALYALHRKHAAITRTGEPVPEQLRAFVLDRVKTLIAYVRAPHPEDMPLPDAVRAEMYEALESYAGSLNHRAVGRPPVRQRLLCARIVYELFDLRGMPQKDAIHVALKLIRLPNTEQESDAVSRLYRRERSKKEFREIDIGHALFAVVAALSSRRRGETDS